eukprot:CAMPEP_0204053904 /NCGR_PEP_ID=MMETSP0360-20130528/127549_1 /ASSEMBLY_ACC=CAM_ASM_000342 /TAXON_ID=268821 /ORGANISM="Scrippsiella Hangoei, Strain SHTV-5" /LENGTH=302 /DNA_ID=CAMNT_0051001135 /DNA_START=56 /DNA_END=961 /DNA_ORIENTATION=+
MPGGGVPLEVHSEILVVVAAMRRELRGIEHRQGLATAERQGLSRFARAIDVESADQPKIVRGDHRKQANTGFPSGMEAQVQAHCRTQVEGGAVYAPRACVAGEILGRHVPLHAVAVLRGRGRPCGHRPAQLQGLGARFLEVLEAQLELLYAAAHLIAQHVHPLVDPALSGVGVQVAEPSLHACAHLGQVAVALALEAIHALADRMQQLVPTGQHLLGEFLQARVDRLHPCLEPVVALEPSDLRVHRPREHVRALQPFPERHEDAAQPHDERAWVEAIQPGLRHWASPGEASAARLEGHAEVH